MADYAYLDTSAIVKLAIREPETDALETDVAARRGLVSSRLGAAEALRAARRAGAQGAVERIEAALEALYLFEITADVCQRAGQLAPPELRTGDAIHLATALAVGSPGLDFVTYDERLARAARAVGLHVVQPGLTGGAEPVL